MEPSAAGGCVARRRVIELVESGRSVAFVGEAKALPGG